MPIEFLKLSEKLQSEMESVTFKNENLRCLKFKDKCEGFIGYCRICTTKNLQQGSELEVDMKVT